MTAPPAAADAPRRSRAARIVRLVAAVLLAAIVISIPWTAPRLLATLAFFRVKKVEIRGAVYLPPADLIARLRLDSTASVWDDPAPLVARLRRHPQVRDVRIERKLPGTLVVRVDEHLPTALVPSAKGFAVIDERGQPLPVDPAAAKLDLPILASRDTGLARLLAELRASYPDLFGRVSEIRRVGRDELLVRLPELRVRALTDLTPDRLAETIPVEADLARRHLGVAELDLRYRDQVIARLQ